MWRSLLVHEQSPSNDLWHGSWSPGPAPSGGHQQCSVYGSGDTQLAARADVDVAAVSLFHSSSQQVSLRSPCADSFAHNDTYSTISTSSGVVLSMRVNLNRHGPRTPTPADARGAVTARWAHTPVVLGSSPTATPKGTFLQGSLLLLSGNRWTCCSVSADVLLDGYVVDVGQQDS